MKEGINDDENIMWNDVLFSSLKQEYIHHSSKWDGVMAVNKPSMKGHKKIQTNYMDEELYMVLKVLFKL